MKMTKLLLFAALILYSCQISAQTIYSKAFGNASDQALIFLHGGPGFNSAGFEVTTAQALADSGFYVLVYDRRGEGRSTNVNSAYTFEQTFEDLSKLYDTYGIKKAGLIGHSFGGMVAILFAEKHPEKVSSTLLVGAPVSLQDSFKNILSTSETLYEANKDSVNLGYINTLKNMDASTMEYASYAFMHAMQNGFYTSKSLSDKAKEIYGRFKTDPTLLKYGAKYGFKAPQGFWKNEKYTSLDLGPNIDGLKRQKMPIFGLYGKEDGLYSRSQVMNLEKQLGKNQLQYLDHCSHNVFIDQQEQFIKALNHWLK